MNTTNIVRVRPADVFPRVQSSTRERLTHRVNNHGRTLTMYTQAGSVAQLTDPSLTDVILTLCASGHFGVREAIAAATRQDPRRMGPNPSDASTKRELDPESSASRPGFPLSRE